MDVERSSLAFSDVPVLPLPSVVLFPGTVLPLQLGEPSYHTLIDDVVGGDSTLAAVMMRPAAADSSTPSNGDRGLPLYDVGCLCRVIHAERQGTGHINVLLHGLHRVRLIEELPEQRPYRRFRVQVLPEATEEALAQATRELARLHSCVLSLGTSMREADAQLCEVLRSTPDPVQLADILCAAVVPSAEIQQQLLSKIDLAERLHALIDLLAEHMAKSGSLPREARMN